MNNISDLCVRVGALFKLDAPASESILMSIEKDKAYANNLLICRNTKAYLEHLVNNPTVTAAEINVENLERTIQAWEKSFYYEDNKSEYTRKYDKYLREADAEGCKPCKEIRPDDFMEVYLDNGATTKIRKEIVAYLQDFYNSEPYANPSSSYAQGQYAKEIIESARETVANCLDTGTDTIYFTGSGSEANNLAIKGIAYNHLKNKGRIITTKTEHASVLETYKHLEKLGFTAVYLDVDEFGAVPPQAVEEVITKDTLLVAVIAVNNEIGTINPLKEIGDICAKAGVPLMVDGIQAFGKIELKPEQMGISLLTFSGHKIYAPKGVGGVYIKKGLSITPLIHGGGQEYGLRSGTENAALISAMGKAAKFAYDEMDTEHKRISELNAYVLKRMKLIDPDFIIYGSSENREPHNISIGLRGVNTVQMIKSLNRMGICVSGGAACNSHKAKPSHVLAAIGADVNRFGFLRLGLGLETTLEQVDYFLKYFEATLSYLRKGYRYEL